MAKPRPGKKAKARAVQPQLPGMPPPLPPGTTRVLPMQLQVGDRLADETGEWEVISRPYTTAGGKTAHVRLSPTCVGTALTSSSNLGRASDGSRSGGSLHCGRKT